MAILWDHSCPTNQLEKTESFSLPRYPDSVAGIYSAGDISWKMMTYFCNSGCSGSAMYSSISTSLFILIIFPYNFLVHWFLDLSEDVDDCWIFLFQQLVYRVISKIRDDFEKITFTKSWRKLKWIWVMLRRAGRKITPLFWFFSLFLPPVQ